MRVLHLLSGWIASGAGKGAFSLHQGLQKLSVDSIILGRLKKQEVDNRSTFRFGVPPQKAVAIANRLNQKWLQARHGKSAEYFQPIAFGLSPHRHALFRTADVVHVQWSQASALGRSFWQHVGGTEKPVVFTLRDMWLFTGGCHFSDACVGYESGCKRCPILQNRNQHVTARDVRRKKEAYGNNVTFVAISETIAHQARRSEALRNCDIRVIPNSIAIEDFKPIGKDYARRKLGLPPDKFIACFGALDLSEKRKGADVMKVVLASLIEDDIFWITFGSNPPTLPKHGKNFGRITDPARLNLIMAAADLFVMPSLQESFGKTTAEALSSGTATIAFKDTPADEIIQDGRTGWLVPHNDACAVSVAIKSAQAMARDSLWTRGKLGREHVYATYSPQTVARAHVELYEEVIGRTK